MAEAVVNLVAEKLGSLLVQEVKLLASVKHEIEALKSELQIITSFLKDADMRAAAEEEEGECNQSNDSVRIWVKQVRAEAYRIEDVIDEYILYNGPHAKGRSLFSRLHTISWFIKKLKLRHLIATEIEDIKLSLAEIQRRAEHYCFRYIDQETRNVITHDSRVGAFFIDDAELVGIDSIGDKLIDWLINGRQERSVIAVVGEGGLGKTTLAGKVYRNPTVRNHFSCQAWITVGREHTKRDILRTIIQQLFHLREEPAAGEIHKMEEKELITVIREHLKDSLYMIVFDDVWKIDFWEDVEHALFDNNKSSRVMLTTRHRKVADFCKASAFLQVHELEHLPPDEVWKLFCRKAFKFSCEEGCCPPELEKLSQDIVEKCEGLPLAIVAVGGLLSTKNKFISEWQKVLDGLGSKLGSDPHLKSCNRVLSEGYYDLPCHLKSCLLYFGLFPASYSINCKRLIRLWIAEGFVPYNTRLLPEQIAEGYLTELVDRCLVQVSERDFSGRARSCRVHDLMHEIILRKTKQPGFCQVLTGDDLSHLDETRRVSMHDTSTDGVVESIKDSKIRSIFLFSVDQLPDSLMITFVGHFKLLKILDLEDAHLDYIPEEVGNLFHLHYLSVRNTDVKKLPKSIGKLLNLETLDLKQSFVSELPIGITNLRKLRYLVVYHFDYSGTSGNYARGVKIQEGFGNLIHLQKLYLVEANSKVVKELRKLRQLRKLGIRLTKGNENDIWSAVANMEKLESLTVKSTCREEILDIPSTASPPQCLQRLYLEGLNKLPDWIAKLKNLTRIGLFRSGLSDDPMQVLQVLPNLVFIQLKDSYHGEQLHIKEGWFLKLQNLNIIHLKGLKCLIIDKGAMPSLRQLTIGPIPLLKEIPRGIEHLRNLKFLQFFHMLTEVLYMMKDEKWEQVTKHIPEVVVTFMMEAKFIYCPAKSLTALTPEDLDPIIEDLEATGSLMYKTICPAMGFRLKSTLN